MNKKTIPFPLRMEEELKFAVRKAAKLDRRSMNAWLQIAIEEKLSREQKKEVAA